MRTQQQYFSGFLKILNQEVGNNISTEDDRGLGRTNMNVYLLKSIGNLPKPENKQIKLVRKEQVPELFIAHYCMGDFFFFFFWWENFLWACLGCIQSNLTN